MLVIEFFFCRRITMDTVFPKVDPAARKWYLLDAKGKPVGRLSSKIARLLDGKDKPTYCPHIDCGDHVVVINADKVMVTGKKRLQMIYYHYTGYTGGLRETTFEKMMAKRPERVIEHAVKGMLPQGRLGRAMFRKLKVYTGEAHPHQAQNPVKVEF